MATMIPVDIAEFKTEGEGRFYAFLEQVARLPSVCSRHGWKKRNKEEPYSSGTGLSGEWHGR
jgi:hypothetical protein